MIFIRTKLNSLKQIPGSIWAISTAIMLISISSLMTFSITPFYMTEVLGVSFLAIGAIEGFAEGFSQIMRLFAGMTGDYLKRNKPTLMVGFILATISKPLFILANGVSMIVISKLIERLSNGLMATPRDAFVSSSAPEGKKGQCLGLLMTMKTIGCTIGSLLIGALLLFTDNYMLLLWIGFIVCFIGIFVLGKYVKENKSIYSQNNVKKEKFKLSELKKLGPGYWTIIIIAAIFMAARISDSFIVLRFKELGGSTAVCASLLGIFNLVSAFCCYPIGYLSDKFPRHKLLAISFCALVLSHLTFSYASNTSVGMIGVLLWGVQRGTSQVLITSIISDIVPRHIIGTSIGAYCLLTGIVAFSSGVIAGKLADASLIFAFQYGVILSFLALCMLLIREFWIKNQNKKKVLQTAKATNTV